MLIYIYAAYAINEHDTNDLHMIGVYSDLISLLVYINYYMKKVSYLIFKVEEMALNTFGNFINKTFFLKINSNDILNSTIVDSFDKILNKC